MKVLFIIPFFVLVNPGRVARPPLDRGVEGGVAGDGGPGAQALLLHAQRHHAVQVHGNRTVGTEQPVRSHSIAQSCQIQSSGQDMSGHIRSGQVRSGQTNLQYSGQV